MIGKIIGILFIISVIGSIMEKIEKSKKKKETKNNNKNLYIKSQANINTVYNKKFKENDIIMFAVAMQDTLESMTGKMLTKQEISGLAQNYRFAYENFNEDDVYWGNYGASYKINGKDLYHPLFRRWESNFTDEDKKMMYQLKDFNRKFSDFIGENYDIARVFFTLTNSVLAPDLVEKLKKETFDGEELAILGDKIYLYLPKDASRSKLNNNYVEKRLKIVATTRNFNTLSKLITMVDELTKE